MTRDKYDNLHAQLHDDGIVDWLTVRTHSTDFRGMVVTFKAHGDGTVRFDYLGNSFTMRNGGGNEPRYVILHGADQSVIAQNDDPRRAVEEVFAIVDDYGVKGRSMLHELRSRFDDYEIRASRAAW